MNSIESLIACIKDIGYLSNERTVKLAILSIRTDPSFFAGLLKSNLSSRADIDPKIYQQLMQGHERLMRIHPELANEDVDKITQKSCFEQALLIGSAICSLNKEIANESSVPPPAKIPDVAATSDKSAKQPKRKDRNAEKPIPAIIGKNAMRIIIGRGIPQKLTARQIELFEILNTAKNGEYVALNTFSFPAISIKYKIKQAEVKKLIESSKQGEGYRINPKYKLIIKSA